MAGTGRDPKEPVPGPRPDEDRAASDADGERAQVTGWAREEPSRERDATQRFKRKRITLDVAGPPLALPDAPNANVPLPEMDPPSAELSLPDLERLMLGRAGTASEVGRSSTPQPFALEDGWGRSREIPPTNAPPRARASTPPPFNVAGVQGVKPIEPPGKVVPKPRAVGSTVLDLEGEMFDRYALGDFTGALLAAELVLGKQADHFEARKCAESCRERLAHLHLSRLGGASRIPKVGVEGSEVRWLGLDHRAGFILSRVDGASSIDELVNLSGMPRHEALKLLVELVHAGALRF